MVSKRLFHIFKPMSAPDFFLGSQWRGLFSDDKFFAKKKTSQQNGTILRDTVPALR